nr:MAG TPA: hypothetical protein [Caudoviricetes sp.]
MIFELLRHRKRRACPVVQILKQGFLSPLQLRTGVHAACVYHVLSDRHKKSANGLRAVYLHPCLNDLNTAIIRKVFERAKI